MKGYKVVNISEWASLPEIFNSVQDAREAKDEWKYGKTAVIEYFNSRNKRAKIIKG